MIAPQDPLGQFTRPHRVKLVAGKQWQTSWLLEGWIHTVTLVSLDSPLIKGPLYSGTVNLFCSLYKFVDYGFYSVYDFSITISLYLLPLPAAGAEYKGDR